MLRQDAKQTILVAGLSLHAFLVPFFIEFEHVPWRLTTTDVLGFLVLGIWLTTRWGRRAEVASHPLFWPTVAFAGAHLAAAAVAQQWELAVREGVKVAGILAFLLCAVDVLKAGAARRSVGWALVLSGTLLSAVSLLESSRRIAGTLGNPNTLAAVLSVIIPIGVAFAVDSWSSWRRGLAFVVGAGTLAMTVALALTLSRGAWVGLAAGLIGAGIVSWPGRPRVAAITIVLILVLSLAFLAVDAYRAYQVSRPNDEPIWAFVGEGPIVGRLKALLRPTRSDETRVQLAVAAWRMYRDHIALGVGPGNFESELPDYPPPTGRWRGRHEFPHSFPLHVAAETGTVGLITFVWWVYAVLRQGLRGVRSVSRGKSGWSAVLCTGAFAGIVAALVGSLFGYPFVHGVWEPFVYAIALAMDVPKPDGERTS